MYTFDILLQNCIQETFLYKKIFNVSLFPTERACFGKKKLCKQETRKKKRQFLEKKKKKKVNKIFENVRKYI